MVERAILFGGSDYIKRIAGDIDDRSAGDADLGQNVAGIHVGGRQRGHAGVGIQEADAPQRRRSGRVGVEGVDAIVLRRHNHDIVNSIARHRDLRQVEWLRIDRTVNRERVQFAEMCRVYVARSENGFANVLAGAGVVIVVGGHDGQTGGSQRFGGGALRMWRRIGRDQVVIRPGSAFSSAGLAQLHRQQH